MKRGMFSKKSVILSWTYSYIVVLLIPMIAIFVNHHFNAQVLEKEIIRVNEQTLINLQGYVDGILEREVKMYNYFRENDSFIEIMMHDSKNKYFYNNVTELKKVLADHLVNDAGLRSVICFIDKDYMLDSEAGGVSGTFYKSKEFTNNKSVSYENWMENMTQVYDNEFFVSNSFLRNTQADQIIYANTVTLFKNKSANIFICFPLSEVVKLTENTTSHILLETGDEYILYMSDGQQKPLLENLEESASGEFMMAGESYICLSKASSVGNLTYKMLISEQEIKEESVHVRNTLLICVALTVILSALCVAIMLRSNVRPLLSLLNKLGAKEIRGNEYAQIEKLYNSISQQNQVMQKEIYKKNQRIQNSELLDWLKGRIQNFDEGHVPAELQEETEFCLVGFKVPLRDQEKIQHDEILYSVIDNIFSELMHGQQFYKIHDGQHIFFLFAIDKGQEEEWRQICLDQMKVICDLIEDKAESQIISVIGSNYGEKLEELRFLYREVMEGFAYTAIIGGSGVVNLADMYLEDVQLDFMVTLELAMQKETPEEMLKSVGKIFGELDNSPLHVVQVQLLEIFQKLLQYIYKYASDEITKREFFEFLEVLLEVKTKEKAIQVLKDILLYAYKALGFHREKTQNGIVENIKEYVEQHYADRRLNVKEIASDLGWNPRYMSRVFREETNEGILDYINHVRISKAVILMNSRKMSIEKVSEEVGYASSDAFRRIFKQKMGVSPNKYKP